MSGTLTRHNEPPIIPAPAAYRLDKNDLDSLKAFWTELRSRDLDSPVALGVAVRRFNFAFGRTRLEERLLDLAIAFEALLLKESERDKTGRLARRCSRLLANDPQQRRMIYRETEVLRREKPTSPWKGSASGYCRVRRHDPRQP